MLVFNDKSMIVICDAKTTIEDMVHVMNLSLA